jgi:hypothetical protein
VHAERGVPPVPGCFAMAWSRPSTAIAEKPASPRGPSLQE